MISDPGFSHRKRLDIIGATELISLLFLRIYDWSKRLDLTADLFLVQIQLKIKKENFEMRPYKNNFNTVFVTKILENI